MDYGEFKKIKKGSKKTSVRRTSAKKTTEEKRIALKANILKKLESEAYMKNELSRELGSTSYMVERELKALVDEGVVTTAHLKTGGLMPKGPYFGLTSKLD